MRVRSDKRTSILLRPRSESSEEEWIVVMLTRSPTVRTMYGLRVDLHLRIARELPLPPKQLDVGEGQDAKGLREARPDLVEIRSRGRAVARIV